MIELKNNLELSEKRNNFCNWYFSGLSQYSDGLDVLRIASYVTFVVPIVVYVGWCLVAHEKRLGQEKITALATLEQKFQDHPENVTQNELVTVLESRVADGDYEVINTAFQRLQSASQIIFFKKMAQKGKLLEVLKHLPPDTQALYFDFQSMQDTMKFRDFTHFIRQVMTEIKKQNLPLKNLEIWIQNAAYCNPLKKWINEYNKDPSRFKLFHQTDQREHSMISLWKEMAPGMAYYRHDLNLGAVEEVIWHAITNESFPDQAKILLHLCSERIANALIGIKGEGNFHFTFSNMIDYFSRANA